jgi:hypothetical protein
VSNGDPGGWEVEGTNGPTFAAFNGRSYKTTAHFDAPVPAFSLDATAASGAPTAFALEGYRGGTLVERNAVTLVGLNEWMNVALTQEVDQVVIMGSTVGVHPFGIDNLHWGLDAPARLDVAIDVKPGNAENPVNPGSNGVMPVALLGAEGFDVTDVDVASLALGVNGAPAEESAYEDANGTAGWIWSRTTTFRPLAPPTATRRCASPARRWTASSSRAATRSAPCRSRPRRRRRRSASATGRRPRPPASRLDSPRSRR